LPTEAPGLDHVAIAVKDLDRATEIYEQLLGLRSHGRERVENQKVEVAFLGSGNGRIELISPVGTDSGVAKFLEKRGEGLHHICVNVADLNATLRLLRDRGVPLIDESPRAGAGGSLIAFVHPKGALGVLIELRQASED
jgi:methylmalonyl-CoA/ethylmalonyl-CoA epimerase